jgi:predicted Fe-Mo cluster-binding NifX family protein
MENYLVVLFKNKKKKKIIKKFVTFNRAKLFYDNIVKESQEVIFNVEVESGKECRYEIGLVEMSGKQLVPVYMTDEFGRSIKVKLDDEGMTLFQISQYKKEELIYDVKESKKITVNELIKKYLRGDGMKMVSVLNNKVVVQQEEKFHLFTLKNEQESSRFVDCLSLHFFKIKRGDCLFVKDYSSAQRKYLYGILESNGFSKRVLYRKFTSLPQSK